MFINNSIISTKANSTNRAESIRKEKGKKRRKQKRIKITERAKSKDYSADQFYICKLKDNKAVFIIAIEYKTPHKITSEKIIVDFTSEIVPARDVINQKNDNFTFLFKSLMAAVII